MTPQGEMRDERTPEPVSVILEWVNRFAGVEPDVGGSTAMEGAHRALAEALTRPGRDREGAYALLAADALLTWATEDAAHADDPAAVLEGVLAQFHHDAARGEG